MKNWRILLTLLLVSVLLTTAIAYAQTPADAVASAAAWLKAQQQADGRFASLFGAPYDQTNRAITALLASGEAHTAPVVTQALDFPASEVMTITATITDTQRVGQLLATVSTAQADPTDFGGVNLITTLNDYYEVNGAGQYGTADNTLAQAWAVLGLATAGEEVPTAAVDKLKSLQDASGGWDGGWGVDVDATAIAMRALIAAGEAPDSAEIIAGLAYVATQQGDDGGFQSWGTSNSNVTAQAIMTIRAAGQDPYAAAWQKNGNDPVSFLLSLQETSGEDAGRFKYSAPQAFDPDYILTTTDAIIALAGLQPPEQSTPATLPVTGGAAQTPVQGTPARAIWGSAFAIVLLSGAIAWRKRHQ